MAQQVLHEAAGVRIAHGLGDPQQVVVLRGQNVCLLVVQILDAVFCPTQKDIGLRQCFGHGRAHAARACQLRQRVQRGAQPQFGKLAATHHLQQLYDEFDFADAAARDFDVVGTFRPPRAAGNGMVANLVVQHPQRFVHIEVQIAPKDKRQHHMAQLAARVVVDGCPWRHDTAFHPGKAFPLAPLHLQVVGERFQRCDDGAGVAVGAQRQVNAKDKAVLSGFADQLVQALGRFGEIFLKADAVAARKRAGLARCACGLAVGLVQIDQVDIAGNIQFACAQLAHAHDPEIDAAAIGLEWCAVQGVKLCKSLFAGHIQRQFGQMGHAGGNVL